MMLTKGSKTLEAMPTKELKKRIRWAEKEIKEWVAFLDIIHKELKKR